MYSESDLESAIDAGVMPRATADAFRDHVAALRQSPAVDEEQFRLVTGFNDIFVALALLLVFVPLVNAPGLLVAGLGWALAEFFTRRRRMALPSILLLLAFLYGVARLGAGELGIILWWPGSSGRSHVSIAIVGAVCAAAAALHWWRFKVPITVAAGVAGLVGAASALLSMVLPRTAQLWVLLAVGVAVFAVAMWWDRADLERRTRRSDVAFWLHLLAAPLIAHPIFTLLGVFRDGGQSSAALIFGLYAVFAVVSLAVDRRALLVSGLGYFGYAVFTTIRSSASNDAAEMPSAMIVGAVLLLLSAVWGRARSALVIYFPDKIRRSLPPIQRGAVSR